MTIKFECTVPQEDAGTKLDRVVMHLAKVSRRQAREMIALGRVRINRRLVRILTLPVPSGARIQILETPSLQAPEQVGRPQSRVQVRILYLDRWLVALDKPAGLLSETDRFGSPSMQTVVPKLLEQRGEHTRLWLVHRLDAGTSGVLLMARTPGTAAALNALFRETKIQKTYWALCQGRLLKTQTVRAAIARIQGTRHGVAAHGRAAETQFRSLAATQHASLVECAPKTGRTHQIRVHLAHLGHPILGDRLYQGMGYWQSDVTDVHQRIHRAMLHAHTLVFEHPKTNVPMRIQSPVPQDFADLMQTIGLTPPKS